MDSLLLVNWVVGGGADDGLHFLGDVGSEVELGFVPEDAGSAAEAERIQHFGEVGCLNKG